MKGNLANPCIFVVPTHDHAPTCLRTTRSIGGGEAHAVRQPGKRKLSSRYSLRPSLGFGRPDGRLFHRRPPGYPLCQVERMLADLAIGDRLVRKADGPGAPGWAGS